MVIQLVDPVLHQTHMHKQFCFITYGVCCLTGAPNFQDARQFAYSLASTWARGEVNCTRQLASNG